MLKLHGKPCSLGDKGDRQSYKKMNQSVTAKNFEPTDGTMMGQLNTHIMSLSPKSIRGLVHTF